MPLIGFRPLRKRESDSWEDECHAFGFWECRQKHQIALDLQSWVNLCAATRLPFTNAMIRAFDRVRDISNKEYQY